MFRSEILDTNLIANPFNTKYTLTGVASEDVTANRMAAKVSIATVDYLKA